jgi:hypothetical protein
MLMYQWTNKFDKKKCIMKSILCTLGSPGLGLAFGAF